MICLIDSKRNNTTTRFNRIRLQSLRFYCSFNYFTCKHSVHYIFYSFFSVYLFYVRLIPSGSKHNFCFVASLHWMAFCAEIVIATQLCGANTNEMWMVVCFQSHRTTMNNNTIQSISIEIFVFRFKSFTSNRLHEQKKIIQVLTDF